MNPLGSHRHGLAESAGGGFEEQRRLIRPPRSGRWFRSLVENASDVVAILEADGSVRYVSPAIERMIGYKPEERIGRSGFELLHPDDLPRARSKLAEAVRSPGVAHTLELRMLHRDGSWRHVELIGTSLLHDPSVRGIVVNWRDVTERQEAEEALKESELRFRVVFDRAATGIALTDARGHIQQSNYALQRMLDYSEDELRGTHFAELTHPEDVKVDVAHFERLVAGEIDHYSFEKRYVRKDGRLIWGRLTASSTHSDSGEPHFFISMVEDITERKEAEQALEESERLLRTVVGNVPVVLFALDGEGVFTLSEGKGLERLGLQPGEVVGRSVFEVYGHIPEVLKHVRRALGGEEVSATVMVAASAFETLFRPLFGEDSKVIGVIGVAADVTERVRVEEALRESEERYRNVVENQTDLVCRFLPDRTLTFVNDAYCRYFGKSREDLIGSNFIHHIPQVDRALYEERLCELKPGNPTRTVEHRVFMSGGEVRWQQWTDRAIFDKGGNVIEYQSVGRDITDRKALEVRLEHQALHDPLTGLPNRRLFMDRLGHALKRTRRSKRKAAVLFMDVDEFKIINDSLGHVEGDRLLVSVADRLSRCLRSEETLARFGGDEFAVLIEGIESPDEAVRVAKRIISTLKEPFILDGRRLFLTASIGLAHGDARTKAPKDLLRDADTAMYRAKFEGTEYKVFDEDMYEQAVRRLELENDLREAIENQEFVVYFQPIVNLQTGGVWGFEALVRWDHPALGLLDPEEFISIAEESGLIVPIGEQVLKEACRRTVEWQREFRHVPRLLVSVNLSARQLRSPVLLQVIEETLQESGLEAKSISFDVTESAYIDVADADTAVLDRLTALGLGLSIDDFGTGYSSLSYIKRFPADTLKIDKSFVRGLGLEVEDTAILQTTVDLAHILGMDVVAEGVEIEEQVVLLKEMGCDLAQGSYFSMPLPPDEVPRYLAERR